MDRRPLQTRAAHWPRWLAERLVALGATPNQISVLSVAFAALGAVAFLTASPVGLLLAAGLVQLRLLCNLLDGLMAVEGGLKTATGDLFNDVPDRIADVLLLVAAASVIPELAWLGWAAAVLAVTVAYMRVLGASLLGTHDFRGPMAKPQRMFALTVGALAGAAELLWLETAWALIAALVLIIAGSLVTLARRLRSTVTALEAR